MFAFNTFIISIAIAVFAYMMMDISIISCFVMAFLLMGIFSLIMNRPKARNVLFFFFGIIDGLIATIFITSILDSTILKDAESGIMDNTPLLVVITIVMIIIFTAINKDGADKDDRFNASSYETNKIRKSNEAYYKAIKKEERERERERRRKIKSGEADILITPNSSDKPSCPPAYNEPKIQTETNWDKL